MDLQPSIRSFLLADATFSNYLSAYNGSKALFTRRPVPTDALYPLGVISPIITYREQDFIGKKHFTIAHDVLIFDTNESATNYRNVEAAAFRVRQVMHRLHPTSFTMPSGYNLVQCLANEPIPGPTDDLIKVSRVVMLTFEINEE
jgi:hypothetical protein